MFTPACPAATKFISFTPTAETVLHLPRAGLEATSSSSTTGTSSSATTTRPFFQDPSTITPSSKPDSGQGDNTLAKSVLEYAILAVGIVIIGGLILQRCVRLRRHNEPLSRFFSPTPHPGMFTSSSSSHPLAHPLRFPRTSGLSEVPPYPYAQHTRAHDTDAAGRRLGGLQSSDHDGYIGDKDVLPAYDNAGGPPKYRDLEMMPMPTQNSGSGQGTGMGTRTGTGAGTDRGVGTGASTVSGMTVGCAEPGVREPAGPEPRSHTHSPSGGSRPDPDVERGDAIPPPAPVYVRGHLGT